MKKSHSMINVLYLSYDGMTDPLGQSQVIPYLQGLTRHGYRFILVSFEKPERYKEGEAVIRKIVDDAGIIWVPLMYHKTPPVLSTLYDLYLLSKKAFSLHQEHNFQIVHCRSYIPALVGWALKKKMGLKFMFDMRGFWADERVEGRLWKLSNPVYRLVYRYFKRKEKQLLQEADYTITLTHKAKDIIHQWNRIEGQPIPIQVIPCCVDTQLFDPEKINTTDQDALRRKLSIPAEAFVLTYLGSLGTWYLVEEMLGFYKKLREAEPDAFFLVVTKDSPEEILRICQKHRIPTDRVVVTSAARREVPLYLSLSSWSIFFIKPVFSKQASSATKMGEIMSMGVPFITNPGWGDVEEIVGESGEVGIVYNYEEGLDFTDLKMRSAVFSLDKTKEMVDHYFSLEQGVNAYSKVYQTLMVKEFSEVEF